MMGYLSKAAAVMLVHALADPVAAQRIKAGLLTCDVSAGIGLNQNGSSPGSAGEAAKV